MEFTTVLFIRTDNFFLFLKNFTPTLTIQTVNLFMQDKYGVYDLLCSVSDLSGGKYEAILNQFTKCGLKKSSKREIHETRCIIW